MACRLLTMGAALGSFFCSVGRTSAGPIITPTAESSATWEAGTDFMGFISESADPLGPFRDQSVHYRGSGEGGSSERLGDAWLVYRFEMDFRELVRINWITVSGAAFNPGGSLIRLLDAQHNVLSLEPTDGGNTYQTFVLDAGGAVGQLFFLDEFDTSSTWRFRDQIAIDFAGVSSAQPEVVMEWVTVGDPGNAADTRYETPGYGGVNYVYNIGRYEVTNAQYCEFLNAVAADDRNGLYNTEMGGAYGGIARRGSAGSYTYSPSLGRGNMPVNYVSVPDTLRFANWMHNGKPSGVQGASTTEDGAYDVSLGSSAVRKPGARVFLPNEDEWYKAAYYKGGGTDAGYWDYPTQSDIAPRAEAPPGTDFLRGSAKYDLGVNDLTYVGSYTAKPSRSAYGTFDQGGNVWELNELAIGSARGGVRGGSSYSNDIALRASYRCCDIMDPMLELDYVGFRVAGVPALDGDGDVDLQDFGLFQRAFTRPR